MHPVQSSLGGQVDLRELRNGRKRSVQRASAGVIKPAREERNDSPSPASDRTTHNLAIIYAEALDGFGKQLPGWLRFLVPIEIERIAHGSVGRSVMEIAPAAKFNEGEPRRGSVAHLSSLLRKGFHTSKPG